MHEGAASRSAVQTARDLLRNEGIRALYRGAGVVWSSTIPGTSDSIFSVQFVKKKNSTKQNEKFKSNQNEIFNSIQFKSNQFNSIQFNSIQFNS